jgi:branched-chain amino acid transport system permease protein
MGAALLQAVVSGVLTGGEYALIGVGLTLLFGVVKVINFAHGSLMMLGMYISYFAFVFFGIDPYVSVLITIPILFFVGITIQAFLIDRVLTAPHMVQFLLTFALLLVIENLAGSIWGSDFRVVDVSYATTSVDLAGIVFSVPKCITFLITVGIIFVLFTFLRKSDIGKGIQATADDARGAMLVGVDVKRMYRIAFGISAASAGAMGSVTTPFFYVHPFVGDTFILTAFVVVFLGGMGSFLGALIGGLIIGVVDAVGAILLPGSLNQFVMFGLLLVILLFRPQGFFKR